MNFFFTVQTSRGQCVALRKRCCIYLQKKDKKQNNMAASVEHVGPTSEETEPPESVRTEPNNSPGTSESESEKPEEEEEEEEAEPPGPKIRETPQDIQLEAIANTVALHPARDVLVCGDVDGDVYAFSYSCTEGDNRELWSSGHHLKSCRQVRISADGLKVYTVSRDKAVHQLDMERGQLVSRIRGAHGAPINSLLLVDENLLATGDDGGTLKVGTKKKAELGKKSSDAPIPKMWKVSKKSTENLYFYLFCCCFLLM